MNSCLHLRVLHPASLSRLPFESLTGKRWIRFASAFLLLSLSHVFAQQYPQMGPPAGPQISPAYNTQYGPPEPVDAQQQPYQAQPQPYDQQPQSYPQQNQQQPLNADQLEQLVAPIALYPDNLLAIVLAASTYPMQVVQADRWRQSLGNVSSDQVAGGADAQSWDPSIKALTAVPQVLAQMDQNLQWTTELGNAYFNQPQDVMEAVQIMRQRAQSAGNLQNSPQQTVGYSQGNIALYPANPQVVYVPTYNPWSVYGQPVSPYPGFSLLGALGSFFGSTLGSSPIQWGLGIAMSAFGHTPWGLLTWGLNWLTQSVLFNHSNYYSNSTTVADWHLPSNGMRAYSGARTNSSYMASNSYGRGNYNMRPTSGYRSGYGSGFAQPQRPAYGYGETRQQIAYAHNYQTPGANYARPTQEAYNRTPPPIAARPQQPYSRPAYSSYGYGSNFSSRPAESYAGRSAPAFSSPTQTYRAPTSTFARNDFAPRSSGTFAGNSFTGYSDKQSHSGGFHLFGGSHSSENPYGGGRAPKGFSAPKSFSSPKSFSAPKSYSAHSSAGGFHLFGGHSGGGGHSSSHGGGGHHH